MQYNKTLPTSTKNFSCLNPHLHVKKDICMIKSENHILVILRMFTKSSWNICVKCKIFLDDGVKNTVSDWCQKKNVTSWNFNFLLILIYSEFLYRYIIWGLLMKMFYICAWDMVSIRHIYDHLMWLEWLRNWILNFI